MRCLLPFITLPLTSETKIFICIRLLVLMQVWTQKDFQMRNTVAKMSDDTYNKKIMLVPAEAASMSEKPAFTYSPWSFRST